MARRPVSTFEQMFKKKVLPKKKQMELTDVDTVIDIATYRLKGTFSRKKFVRLSRSTLV
jgi:hypothetical protein